MKKKKIKLKMEKQRLARRYRIEKFKKNQQSPMRFGKTGKKNWRKKLMKRKKRKTVPQAR